MAQGEPGARKRQYTARQLKACVCFRCDAPAEFQWSACADGNVWRPLCRQCDWELNAMVIRWYGFPQAERMLKDYAALIGATYRRT